MAQASPAPSRDALATLRINRSRDNEPSFLWRLAKIVLWLLLLAALGAGGLFAADRMGWLSIEKMLSPPLEVRVGMVQIEHGRAADAMVVATGYLESRRQARIGAKSPGRIEVIHVEEGSRVEKGQVLAVLEHADLDASLAASTATMKQTRAELAEHEVRIQQFERDFRRVKKLYESRTVSDDDFDKAKYAYDMAVVRRDILKAVVALTEARVKEAEESRENMFVRAPFSGTVISKDAEVGESILPGGMGEASGRGSVVTIADLEHLEVDTDVKEDFISRISAGQPAEVAVDAVPGTRFRGRVRKIIPMGDRARATIKVKVEVLDADERLFPEMSATVYFLPAAAAMASGEEQPPIDQKKVFCPAEAIQTESDKSYVWVVADAEHTRRLEVETGQTRDGRIEILSGLKGGERVVLNPTSALAEAKFIRVAEENTG